VLRANHRSKCAAENYIESINTYGQYGDWPVQGNNEILANWNPEVIHALTIRPKVELANRSEEEQTHERRIEDLCQTPNICLVLYYGSPAILEQIILDVESASPQEITPEQIYNITRENVSCADLTKITRWSIGIERGLEEMNDE
jgi:hypothetical protein